MLTLDGINSDSVHNMGANRLIYRCTVHNTSDCIQTRVDVVD